MSLFQITSLPRILFAHTFRAETYSNTLEKRRDCVEVTLITAGELHFTRGGGEMTARAGDVVCNTYDTPLFVNSEGYHEHLTVCFTAKTSPEPAGSESLSLDLPLLITPDSQTGGRMQNALMELIRLHTLSPDGTDSRLRCAGILLSMLSDMASCARDADRGVSFSHERYAKRAKDYIFNHLDAPIRQQEIASFLGISSEYLCTVFREAEGMPVMTYVNRVKQERIRAVMMKEHLPLYRAAVLYGFADPNYVSRLYKKLFGVSITGSMESRK